MDIEEGIAEALLQQLVAQRHQQQQRIVPCRLLPERHLHLQGENMSMLVADLNIVDSMMIKDRIARRWVSEIASG